jgi:hypothetical protein
MTTIVNNYDYTILPPAPPTEQEQNSLQLIHPESLENNGESPIPALPRETLIPGKFEYIKDDGIRKMLANAWQAITLTETWDFVKQPIESFMWSNDNRIDFITNKMVELGYDGHSGCSFGWTMRQMQHIARYGEEKYREEFLKHN